MDCLSSDNLKEGEAVLSPPSSSLIGQAHSWSALLTFAGWSNKLTRFVKICRLNLFLRL